MEEYQDHEGKKITVSLELGNNLREAITAIVETAYADNSRIFSCSVPIGESVKDAFGINFTEIIKTIANSNIGNQKSEINVEYCKQE